MKKETGMKFDDVGRIRGMEVLDLKNYFKGCYYKHQKENQTLCLIAGETRSEKFIQVITEDFSEKIHFKKEKNKKERIKKERIKEERIKKKRIKEKRIEEERIEEERIEEERIEEEKIKEEKIKKEKIIPEGGNYFSKRGVVLDIRTPELTLSGRIRYKNLSPIRYDIMGPFRFFPMECRHGIISMHHELEGEVLLNGRKIDFTGGNGYMEMDSGRSFPSSYIWVQANDFSSGSLQQCRKGCSVMVSAASIPFYGLKFQGCICVIHYQGKEYRLATYLGVKVLLCTKTQIILQQGKYRLEVRIKSENTQKLAAPQDGKMTRMILETVSCPAEFYFYQNGICMFALYSEHASFEYENEGGCESVKNRSGKKSGKK